MRLPEPQDKRTRLGGYVSYPLGREPRRTPPLARLLSHLPCRKADMMAQPCCMIVEDQALIGMSLEASLEEAGFDVAGPFLSNAQALKWMENPAPELQDVPWLEKPARRETLVTLLEDLVEPGAGFVLMARAEELSRLA